MCLTVYMHMSPAAGVSHSVCICLLASLGIWGSSPLLIKCLPGSMFVYLWILSRVSVSARGGAHS